MDRIGQTELFALNVIMALILAADFWGMYVFIIFALIVTPLYLLLLVSLFIEAGFGFSPAGIVFNKAKAALRSRCA